MVFRKLDFNHRLLRVDSPNCVFACGLLCLLTSLYLCFPYASLGRPSAWLPELGRTQGGALSGSFPVVPFPVCWLTWSNNSVVARHSARHGARHGARHVGDEMAYPSRDLP